MALLHRPEPGSARVFADRLARLHAAEPTALLATLVNALILVLVLWGRIEAPRLLAWLLVLCGIAVARFFLARHPLRPAAAGDDWRPALRRLVIGVALSGLVWGGAGIWLYPTESFPHQVFIAFVLGGMTAGASVAYASFLRVFFAFSVPALVPLIARMLLAGDSVHGGMAAMTLLFGLLITALAVEFRRMLLRSLELRYENLDLIDHLTEAQSELEQANQALAGQRDRLEAAVAERTADLSRSNEELAATIHRLEQARRALTESEEKYRLLVDNAGEGIFIAQDGMIKFANHRTEEICGCSGAELAGIPFLEFVHPDDRERALNYHLARLQGLPAPDHYSFKALRRGGQPAWIEITAVLTRWEGRPAALNLVRDTTEQHQLEKQLFHAQRMEAVGTLAGGIAHEFNNLLQAVQGYAELLLLDLGTDRPRAEKLRRIVQAARRGSELTQQLLDFSRQREPQTEVLPLPETLARIKGLLERTLPKQIAIELDPGPEDLHVCVDPQQFEQVLMNLAVNARDAMPDGGRLVIRAARESIDASPPRPAELAELAAGDYVRLDVEDTGTGMDETVRERIFEPFFTAREVGRGSGLGLAMTYGIIRNHGGTVSCSSVPGQGTRFRLILPACAPAPAPHGEGLAIHSAPVDDRSVAPSPPVGVDSWRGDSAAAVLK